MSGWPNTLEEARKYFYGITYGTKKPAANFVDGRCIEEVTYYTGRWPNHKQCSRKASVDGAWCKQHAPHIVSAKKEDENKRIKASIRADRHDYFFKSHGKEFYDALKKIADGHNNARALAVVTLSLAGEVPKLTED